jgi:hypothetical protein
VSEREKKGVGRRGDDERGRGDERRVREKGVGVGERERERGEDERRGEKGVGERGRALSSSSSSRVWRFSKEDLWQVRDW